MRAPIATKPLADGRALLNLGCGYVTHPAWVNMDFSPYARLARHPRIAALLSSTGILSAERTARLRALDPRIIHWDLRKGIPFPQHSFDVVYHSHVFEHIPREAGPSFLAECFRVLKPGGVIRVVVPDLEALIARYSSALSRLGAGDAAANEEHDWATERVFGQMVRTHASGGEAQRPVVRWLERTFRGDAAASGERHRWMYDRYSLSRSLRTAGFNDVAATTHDGSRIPGWAKFQLDTASDGRPAKSWSLYLEGVRPVA